MFREICGMNGRQYITEGIAQLEKLREEIEEKLGEVEFILSDLSKHVPELEFMRDRAKAYWLSAVQGMMRDSGSMVNMDDTLIEIRRAEDDWMEAEKEEKD